MAEDGRLREGWRRSAGKKEEEREGEECRGEGGRRRGRKEMSSDLLPDVLQSCCSVVRVTEVAGHGWVFEDDLLYGTAALWRSCDSHMRILRCNEHTILQC